MTSYHRLSGGGNDFIALVESTEPPSSDEIAAWCRRGVSVGADGLFILRRAAGGAVMDYFNADGRAADLCLNGTRCAARLALELGWAEGDLVIETGAGPIRARRADAERIQIELPPPQTEPDETTVTVGDATIEGWFLVVGVPHFVILAERPLDRLPLAELGPALRYHERFAPAGANIDWIELGGRGFAIRTWERGVEAETLACGTGILAATAAAVAADRLPLPAEVMTRGGFSFRVDGERLDGTLSAWSLTGDARLVARGEILPGATGRP